MESHSEDARSMDQLCTDAPSHPCRFESMAQKSSGKEVQKHISHTAGMSAHLSIIHTLIAPVMRCHHRILFAILLLCAAAFVIAWNLLTLTGHKERGVDRNLLTLTGHKEREVDSNQDNDTWIHEIKELWKKPEGCALAGLSAVEIFAHCEISIDIDSQNIRMRRNLPLLTPWLAPIVWEGTFDTHLMNTLFRLDLKIGLTVFAVKKYILFLPKFLHSAEKHFMVGRSVRYYIFTDKPDKVPAIPLHTGRSLFILQISGNHSWQEISMQRMEILSTMSKRSFNSEVDYLVCADIDMVFNDHVGVEILGELVATLHPGYFTKPRARFPYEKRPKSQAYILPDEGDFYYMGAFFAGTVVQIYQLTNTCRHAIEEDKSHGIEAVWHDESHLNKYLILHKPTKILSPEYMWDMNIRHGDLVKKKRFLAVPKNHTWIRS